MLRYLSLLAAVLAVLIVCGVVATGERSASASSSSSSFSSSYDPEELQFLELINEYRHNNGVGPLLLSDTIAVAAQRHSHDMATYSFFGHTTASSSYYSVGSRPWNRMGAEGYDYNTRKGENIAVGCESAQRCFEVWRNSASHNAAMLDARYRVIGIARLKVGGSRWYWTTDFGGVLDPTSHAPGESPRTEERNEALVEDGPGIENGQMRTKAVWKQKATDKAELILEGGYARLGDYDNGRDELRQEIRVGGGAAAENASELSELSYWLKIETTERQHRQNHHPSDYLVVRLVDRQGEQLAVLQSYTDADAEAEGGGRWRHERVDLSRYAGRKLYLSFLVKTDWLLTTAFYLDGVALEEEKKKKGKGSSSS